MSKTFLSETCLRLRFLGGCEVLLPDGSVHLETAKTRALLVYLVSNPGSQPRHTLMGLLWGEFPEANARRNLRRALWDIRRQLSVPELPRPLLTDRETVCFNRAVAHWSDVAAFETACSRLAPVTQSPASASDLDGLRSAVELYQGEFLEGFYVNGALAFEEWVLAERERLRVMALQALQYMVEGYAFHNQVEKALLCARHLLALDPWREEAHRWLMRLLARGGQRAEALAQYKACKQVLAEELGVEPALETRALYEQILAGAFQIPASNLPVSTTPFIGRAQEIAEITELLTDADCRLLTLTGLGGVGKTRLAQQVAAQQIAIFARGVHYVSFAAVSVPERIAASLVQSLEIPFVGAVDPKLALLAYLREKAMLLVLDGFEHLLEGTPLLTEILQTAPGIKILVTSRERLNLRGEWVYALTGLACAPDGPAADLASFDAAQLFLQTARRVSLRFQVGEGESLYIARICNLVEGLPLAIELAAVWVRVLSLEEIAAEVTQHLDFLGGATRDRPERQRSIRAVFDHSWRRLSRQEREAFGKLSVFQGSFRPQEAKQVSGASLSILSALVDKSMLQRLPSGRYQIHELLRQYAHEHLERLSGGQTAMRDLHCQAYAALVDYYQQTSTSVPHHQVVESFAADMGNILVAWQWAVQHRNVEAIASMCRGLADYFQLTSSFREGESLFHEALGALGWPEDGETLGDAGTLLRWEMLSVQAMFSVYLGQFSQAQASLERCVAIFAQHGIRERLAHCQFFLGEIVRFQGENDSAEVFFQESLANYQQIEDRAAVGFCLNGLGLVSSARGEQVQARSCLRESLAAFKETDHEMGQAIVSINLADLLIQLGDYPAAREILDKGYALCHKLGHRWGMATCIRYLGDIARLEGSVEDAREAYQQCLTILEDIGQRQAVAGCLIKLGQACAELGEFAEARQHLKKALFITAELKDELQRVDAALSWALLLAAEGEKERALELALLIERYPLEVPATRERASQLAVELDRQIPEEVSQHARRRIGTLTLGSILAAPL